MSSKREYVNILRDKYLQAQSKQSKTEIMTELTSNLGYSRKYAIYKLNKPKEGVKIRQKRNRKKVYPSSLKFPLKKIWEINRKPCSKRLKPILPELIYKLRKFNEIAMSDEERDQLCSLSTWKIDELLKEFRVVRGKSGTKRSKYFLNKKIQVRTNFDDVNEPGHIEMDTVHHCGERLEGKYAVTLNNIDIETLWSEQECFLSCLGRKVISSVDSIRRRLPFDVMSVDFDNGGEFKNYKFMMYCEKNQIEITRSRSYRKNDQCYVEGNNYVDVREVVGYKRYESKEEIDLINDIYRNEHRLMNNFFSPSMKLLTKVREGGKITKKYDQAKTPYQRVLDSKYIDKKTKQKLTEEYDKLNPAQLKRDLDRKLEALSRLARVRKLNQATP